MNVAHRELQLELEAVKDGSEELQRKLRVAERQLARFRKQQVCWPPDCSHHSRQCRMTNNHHHSLRSVGLRRMCCLWQRLNSCPSIVNS